MKRLLLQTALALGITAAAQAQTTQLTITLNATQLPNVDCNLNGGSVASNKVYLHSGVCTSSAAGCDAGILCTNPTVWETVIGNWGTDDGLGLLTSLGNGVFSITFVVESYYNLPQGAVPFAMGLVFRNLDGTLTGKDGSCSDIFIRDIQGTPQAVDCAGNAYAPVTVSKTVIAGMEDASYLGALTFGPNPSAGEVSVNYMLRKPAQSLSAQVMDAQGRLVATLHNGKQAPGAHTLTWDGSQASAGLYTLVLRESGKVLATERIVLQH